MASKASAFPSLSEALANGLDFFGSGTSLDVCGDQDFGHEGFSKAVRHRVEVNLMASLGRGAFTGEGSKAGIRVCRRASTESRSQDCDSRILEFLGRKAHRSISKKPPSAEHGGVTDGNAFGIPLYDSEATDGDYESDDTSDGARDSSLPARSSPMQHQKPLAHTLKNPPPAYESPDPSTSEWCGRAKPRKSILRKSTAGTSSRDSLLQARLDEGLCDGPDSTTGGSDSDDARDTGSPRRDCLDALGEYDSEVTTPRRRLSTASRRTSTISQAASLGFRPRRGIVPEYEDDATMDFSRLESCDLNVQPPMNNTDGDSLQSGAASESPEQNRTPAAHNRGNDPTLDTSATDTEPSPFGDRPVIPSRKSHYDRSNTTLPPTEDADPDMNIDMDADVSEDTGEDMDDGMDEQLEEPATPEGHQVEPAEETTEAFQPTESSTKTGCVRRPLSQMSLNITSAASINIAPADVSSGCEQKKKTHGRKPVGSATPKRKWRELQHLDVKRARRSLEKEEGKSSTSLKGSEDEISDQPVRRSRRQRFRVLKYWQNETIQYERRKSQIMPTIATITLDAVEGESSDILGQAPERTPRKR